MNALDRLLSVKDYEDFARARAGIGMASTRRLFDGSREVMHLTIAAVDDMPIDPTSLLVTALESSLIDFGDLHIPVRVAVPEVVTVVLAGGVRVLPDYSSDNVEPAVPDALLEALGFRPMHRLPREPVLDRDNGRCQQGPSYSSGRSD